MIRRNNRAAHELRPIHITPNFLDNAAGSVLFQIGNTKVLCAVNLQSNVPPFLKGKKTGWLNAEYAMLPAATHTRKERETVGCKRNGRSIEISRLIGRTLRSIIDLNLIGERTIVIDCDVLQADGGTRTAAITGSYLALRHAVRYWLAEGILAQDCIKEEVAAISLGVSSQGILLDLDFYEDSAILADFNFVITKSGKVIEVQGNAEQEPIAWNLINSMYEIAYKAITDIFAIIEPKKNEKKPFNQIVMRAERNY